MANIAREYGAEVPFLRPAELANDFAGTSEVICHAINWLVENDSRPEVACCIYATAPFLHASYLKKGYDELISSNVTSVFSITSYPYSIYRSLKITGTGHVEMIWPEYENVRSQDLSEAYHDAGQFYWINTEKFMLDKAIFAEDSLPVILPRYLVQDIDSVEDWETAERMFLAAKAK